MSDTILITHNSSAYQSWKGIGRILLQKEAVSAAELPEQQSAELLNARQAGCEFEAAEDFIRYLGNTIKDVKLPVHLLPEALQKRDSAYANYGFLYLTLKETLFKCFLFQYQIKILLQEIQFSPEKITIDWGGIFKVFPPAFYLEGAQVHSDMNPSALTEFKLPLIKNTLYKHLGTLLRPSAPPRQASRKRVLLFTHSPLYKDRLLHRFYKEAEADPSIELIIIHCQTEVGGEKGSDASLFRKKGIAFYNYSEFKTGIISKAAELNAYLKNNHPALSPEGMPPFLYATELNYSWMKNIFRIFQPDLVMTTSLGETGRYMADTAHNYSIPSIYIEYSLFTDDAYWMEHRVQFDHKFCIGQESIDLWKRRNDPSIQHHLLGYLRFDESPDPSAEQWIAEQCKHFKHSKTILFASTWSGTNAGFNEEKSILVREIISACEKYGYNLIIKKHPSENDTVLDELVRKPGTQNIFLLPQHSDQYLMPAIKYSDLICCQNSSIGLEALYFRKPFCYLSLSVHKISGYSLLEKCGYSHAYNDLDQFFSAIPKLIAKENPLSSSISERLLFQPDKKVAKYMLDLLHSILSNG